MAKMSEKNAERERNIREAVYNCGVIVISVTASAPGYRCSIGGDTYLPIEIFRKLRKEGLLTPNQDGLLDGCPQTYQVRRPDISDSNVQALPEERIQR